MCGSVSSGSGGGRDHGSARQVARIEQVDTVEEAVLRASRLARSGDTEPLSPACASLDMFSSHVERGERFQCAVQALEVSRASCRIPPRRHGLLTLGATLISIGPAAIAPASIEYGDFHFGNPRTIPNATPPT